MNNKELLQVPRLPALAATGSLLFFPRLYRGVCIEGSSDNDGLIPLTFETVQVQFFCLSSLWLIFLMSVP